MSQTFGARFRDTFAADVEASPSLTLRQADAIDSYGSASARDQTMDVVTDGYLEQYAWGLVYLDTASWRHYLPAFADYAERHLDSGSVVVGSLIASLRPPDRTPPRLASLTSAQEGLIREFLEMLALSEDSAWQVEASQALDEWWLENAHYRPKAGGGDAA